MAKHSLALAHSRHSGLAPRAKGHFMEETLVGGTVAGLTGLSWATYETKAGHPAMVGSVPAKPLAALAAAAIGYFLKPGIARDAVLSLGATTLGIYAYQATVGKTIIAGE